ncbi:MAG: tRNA (N(6)-L-threonylcarbamoyladenosine(37)-C(2))-methylthiotransferase [Candidatus Bathyarchaeota archaeon]|nr:tRNA (N(6)-L-threonylcarbamoyladenosine(37)-C(2))-methylthiotransferase [Chloroflexota bacterium]MCL5877433.1 tRNA (N(6)-L-threonylcarbamoyladenosine(37)-C(2))-methylthiotransferase [Candidatus Bathyarchaeota archaeon]
MPQKVHIKNYGCSSNIADGETLSGCLKQAGYTLTTSETEADLIIYNSCAVKGPTENRIIDDIKGAPKNKKIVVAGCLPKISFERLSREVYFDGAVGPALGGEIVDVVGRVLAGEKVTDLASKKENPLLSLPHQRTNPVVSIVPINFGCLGSCAYCCVVQARGHLRSYSIKDITERVEADFDSGAREFWLTSQDTASYGRDVKADLAALLVAVGGLKGDFRVRVGMMTPNLVTDIEERLICAFESERVFKFLHLPIQSGDNTVLKNMRRFYTVEQFKATVEAFRETFPDLTVATDIIVGYPGETEQAFENTLQLLREVEPDITNVSKFFARPKTAAWGIREGLVDKEETKRRSTIAAELAKQISAKRNQRWVGWVGQVFFDEKGKVEGSWIGRNFAYKPVVVKSSEELRGKVCKVEVTAAAQTYLRGRFVKEERDGELGYVAI